MQLLLYAGFGCIAEWMTYWTLGASVRTQAMIATVHSVGIRLPWVGMVSSILTCMICVRFVALSGDDSMRILWECMVWLCVLVVLHFLLVVTVEVCGLSQHGWAALCAVQWPRRDRRRGGLEWTSDLGVVPLQGCLVISSKQCCYPLVVF